MFVFTDILRRTLEYSDLSVEQVVNFTDFGHLTSDADVGEDKMARGLRREGLEPTLENMIKMGQKYAHTFLTDIKKLNVRTDDTLFPYASEYVGDQVKLIERLKEKGYAYETSDGLYFDTAKFPEYGKLGGLHKSGNENRVSENSEKRNSSDFALWKFNPEIGWDSSFGKGFPGWHIECSAMIIRLLGERIDIHTGGIEHIPVHHNNEIAQSEAATGKSPFSNFWLHRAHLQIAGEKIAKSDGNVVYLSEIVERGFSAISFRYFLLNSTYRTPTNFTWEGLESAYNALERLKKLYSSLPEDGKVDLAYQAKFREKMENDLNTPQALAVLWTLAKDKEVSPEDKRATLADFDKVLGLGLN